MLTLVWSRGNDLKTIGGKVKEIPKLWKINTRVSWDIY